LFLFLSAFLFFPLSWRSFLALTVALTWISASPLDAESGSPQVAYDSISESGWWAMAACKTEISDYNSSIAPWHGQALGDDDGIGVTVVGI